MSTWITVCDTCKQENWDAVAEVTDGERLAALIEGLVNEGESLGVRRHSCLMGCKQACNVTIQSEGKLNYTLGQFDPEESAAAGIVAYAKLHAKSETGQVPYREWPEAIKGHFITRHPPLPVQD
ncbi:DUF1636 domain-containing protein [Actibacterium sp. 188UL27-1]|nr:DUF1636 domain-containing protein [Actibacterium sp. 188UL27-1]